MQKVIGSTVHVEVDRPLGSCHPDYPTLVYTVNYGFVPGVMASDGEWQDAYILSPGGPLKSFTGIVTAILVREDDTETKWVVEDASARPLSDADILSLTRFQEQYFQTRLVRHDI